jgi:signal transduction histidine kinase
MVENLLKHRSGRVIALGRALLASVFLFAIWVDPSEPAQAPAATYSMLAAYVLIAFALLAATWNNWWLDARLAGPAHVFDITVFTLLVLSSDGYTSPFFVFFVFLVLSAAIRWGRRETALTAAAVTVLYFTAGLLAGGRPGTEFDLQRFIIRSSNLVILSVLLIWFGASHRFSGVRQPRLDVLPEPSPDQPPLDSTAAAAMRMAGASRAALLWFPEGAKEGIVLTFGGERREKPVPRSWRELIQPRSYLFDLDRNRALSRDGDRRMLFFTADCTLASSIGSNFAPSQGLAVPVRSEAGDGEMLLGGINDLAIDHIELGMFLEETLASQLQRHAFLRAVGENATGNARLSLARDLHDSIVQFLAGATFRIEAISRSIRSGEKPERELNDLKQLMLLEQQELRSSIGVLRQERVALPGLARDLHGLCERLARQWDVVCEFTAEVSDASAPMRMHLDTHQLIREAVANAVRHGRAKSVRVHMKSEGATLQLDIRNPISGSKEPKGAEPRSLRERVDEANGQLILSTVEQETNVSITLPLTAESRL